MKTTLLLVLWMLGIAIGFGLAGVCNPDNGASLSEIDKAVNAPIRHYQDEQGRTHVEKEAPALPTETAKTIYKSLFDSVCKAVRIKDKQIEDLRAIGTRTKEVIVPVVVKSDSACSFSYSDKWLLLEGSVCSGKDSIRYMAFDSLIMVRYWRRPVNFLGMSIGRKRSYFDAYSLNPNSIVQGLSGVDITDESFERVNLSGYAGYRWMNVLPAYTGGLEMEVFLSRRLSMELNGEYFLNSGKLQPALGGKLKLSLIKF